MCEYQIELRRIREEIKNEIKQIEKRCAEDDIKYLGAFTHSHRMRIMTLQYVLQIIDEPAEHETTN